MHSDVLIIGGGVIGCACAYYLTRDGASVTVLERGRLGHGCSYGNAGWLVPSDVAPLPAPGLLAQAARWLTDPDSPLYVKPRLDWEMAAWLVRFLLHANKRHLRRAAPHLAALHQHSLRLTQRFADEHGVTEDLGLREDGILYVCRTGQEWAAVAADAEQAAAYGVPSRTLDADAVQEAEPALTDDIAGGVLYESDCHAEPLAVVQKMAHFAEQQGATFRTETEVFAFDTLHGKLRGVDTTRGRFSADQVILCAGSWTPVLTRTLGFRVPIQAGKGYALIIDPPDPMPRRPLMLVERKIAVTPRQGSLRLCGTMELAGLDETVTTRRLVALERGARQFLQLPDPLQPRQVWRGLRPCTPDGLPLLGPVPRFHNLFLAAGHAMIGLSTAAASGHSIADLCARRKPALDLAPFSPARFRR